MRTILYLALFTALAVVALGEPCGPGNTKCTHISCPENDYAKDCVHGECTCTHTTKTCSSQNDCLGTSCRRTQHCIDGRCRCGFGDFGGGNN